MTPAKKPRLGNNPLDWITSTAGDSGEKPVKKEPKKTPPEEKTVQDRTPRGRIDILQQIKDKRLGLEQGLSLIKQLTGTPLARTREVSDTGNLYYRPDWQELPLGTGVIGTRPDEPVILFDPGDAAGQALQEHFPAEQLILVKPGKDYRQENDRLYQIDPQDPDHYNRFTDSLAGSGRLPGKIVHGWSLASRDIDINGQLARGIYALFYLTQALMKQKNRGKVRLLYLYPADDRSSLPAAEAVGAFSRTLHLEHPDFFYKSLGIASITGPWPDLPAEFDDTRDIDVRVNRQNQRLVRRFEKFMPGDRPGKKSPLVLKPGGVYLITGGFGGLGLICAEFLASQVQARLVLTDLAPLTPQKEASIQELRALGAEVLTIQADISRHQDVERLLEETRQHFGALNGIIHCAGLVRDAFILKKTPQEIDAVLRPKVFGTLLLDKLTQQEKLDFFLLFSSLAAIVGNPGQADYAYANAFLSAFACWRERLHKRGERAGVTVAIAWPHWQAGGMQLPKESYAQVIGENIFSPLPSEQGLRALAFALDHPHPQYVVLYGQRQKLDDYFKQMFSAPQPAEAIPAATPVDSRVLSEKTEAFLKKIFSQIIKLPVSQIGSSTAFQQLGFDSIMVKMFNVAVEKEWFPIPRTLLFEYQTLHDLCDYFLNHHQDRLAAYFKLSASRPVAAGIQPVHPGTGSRRREPAGLKGEDIAVIGISGRYPMAKNLDQYWENLVSGQDSVSEVPIQRWDWRKYVGIDPEKGGIYCQWGGFLNDVDLFDPILFNISPREAGIMDPQERLFLETVWSTLEDAGYTRRELSRYLDGQEKPNVGVFAGVTSYTYHLLGAGGVEVMALPQPWSLANRVSFVFNFHGPSIPVDTACSSSLTAIHLACESLRKGECRLAIAGGVNLYLHPAKYMGMCRVRMLSATGRCHTFGSQGDGFVPGEGVGAVLLKPLPDAIRDHDHIYAVLKGSAINHGGRTNGYTVPNPAAQARLISRALENAGIDPRTIGFIEAHGTGTILGDPIEIQGLNRAYREFTHDRHYCAISSVKSNIGHLESAAGIAGLTKIILQMKHRQLVPSLHAETLNPNIDFTDSPFYVQQQTGEWKRPQITENGQPVSYPRRAGISSFGAGGANAHVIVEEYEEKEFCRDENPVPQVIILSAQDEGRLSEYAKKLREFLLDREAPDTSAPGPDALLEEKLRADLVRAVAAILDVDGREIGIENELGEYGVDPALLSRLGQHLEDSPDPASLQAVIPRLPSLSIRDLAHHLAGPGNAAPGNIVPPGRARFRPLNLADIAYTFQVGRQPMEFRLALIVSDIGGLYEKLCLYDREHPGTDIPDLYKGDTKSNRAMVEKLFKDQAGSEHIRHLIESRDLGRLAQLWVWGADIDWNLFSYPRPPRRISLPTYPFAGLRCWLPEADTALVSSATGVIPLHPLVEKNTSDFSEQKFSTRIRGDEFYITDHVVMGRQVLPGVVYLEMARAAGELAANLPVDKIAHLVWVRPITLTGEAIDIHIVLSPVFKGSSQAGRNQPLSTATFEVITLDSQDQRLVHAQGKIVYGQKNSSSQKDDPQEKEGITDIQAIRQRCTGARDGAECYRLFRDKGIAYGPAFQAIEKLYYHEEEALAAIVLPPKVKAGSEAFVLHPSLMDAALQAISGLAGPNDTGTGSPYLPFTLGEVRVVAPVTKARYVYITASGTSLPQGSPLNRYDIRLLDAQGRLLTAIKDFSLREFRPGQRAAVPDRPVEKRGTLYYRPEWQKIGTPKSSETAITGSILLFHRGGDVHRALRARQKRHGEESGPVILVEPGTRFHRHQDDHYEINPQVPGHYQQLLAALGQSPEQPWCGTIIHLWCTGEETALARQLQDGIYSLFYLAKALLSPLPKSSDRIRLLYFHSPQPAHSAAAGFFRSVHQENPHFLWKTIELPDTSSQVNDLIGYESASGDHGVEIRWQGHDRYFKTLVEVATPPAEPGNSAGRGIPLKQKGVYLITGGLGAIGSIFADYLARQFQARLVLTDLDLPGEGQQKKIQALQHAGAEVLYGPADVSKKTDVAGLVAKAISRFGRIDGIIHAAGLIQDALLPEKTAADLDRVLAPKLYGTILLAETVPQENLDFFVLFSAGAGVFGNAGQCDYAYANRFMDDYARSRTGKKSTGRILAIDWPLWQHGGMKMNRQARQLMTTIFGLEPLANEAGLAAFENGLLSAGNNFIVLYGDERKIRQALPKTWGSPQVDTGSGSDKPVIDLPDSQGLADRIEDELAEIAAAILKMEKTAFDKEGDFHEYGFDSISLTEFANKINNKYDLGITPAVFFEIGQSTVHALARYLCREYGQKLAPLCPVPGARDNTGLAAASPAEPIGPLESPLPFSPPISRIRMVPADDWAPSGPTDDPIAIIGMSGIMPQSPDLEEFWEHLKAGADLISEVPPQRWDWKKVAADWNLGADSSGVAWGGFMKEVDRFDAEFFSISPREALLMEPQQRLFLQTIFKTIEDAGYKSTDLAGTRTGVFAGVAASEYADLFPQKGTKPEPYGATGLSTCILANRVSFLLNLKGPSEAIDTACSSSLVALHRAVESLRHGTCDMALVGGVHVLITPKGFLIFHSAGMLARDGRCKTFDDRADGYVRSEGVGAILIKPLGRAKQDGDHIYALIVGSAENHGGRAHSLTAPNAAAQSDLLVDAYRKAGIAPATVSYIEAHGTGTKLGDPVEVEALKKAFEHLAGKQDLAAGRPQPYCGLGSVKSNIGHLETAAGMAGIFKVLLAMKHRTLPATIHVESLNSHIQLSDSPFYIVQETQPWECRTDENGSRIPRRAGISSFGFGGANAHIILEEYGDDTLRTGLSSAGPHDETGPQIIVLSARNKEQLHTSAQNLAAFLENEDCSRRLRAEEVAFTLQMGRVEMEERLALVVSSVASLSGKLRRFCSGEDNIEDLYRGNSEGNASLLPLSGAEGEEIVRTLVQNKRWSRLAQLWTAGANIDWTWLYPGEKPGRISLPTYPFGGEHYWPTPGDDASASFHGQVGANGPLHPLIDRETAAPGPDDTGLHYQKHFTGEEFFIADHARTLPAVAYLEMARAAGNLANRFARVRHIGQVVISLPLLVKNGPRQVQVGLRRQENSGWVEFFLDSLENSGENRWIRHATGLMQYDQPADLSSRQERLDITAILHRCRGGQANAGEYYRLVESLGSSFGPRFKGIRELYYNPEEALSRIGVIQEQAQGLDDFVLHPTLTDAAVQSMVAFAYCTGADKNLLYLPYVLGEVEILDEETRPTYAYIRPAKRRSTPGHGEVPKFDGWLLAGDGRILVKLKECAFRPFQAGEARLPQVVYYRQAWKESATRPQVGDPAPGEKILLFASDDDLYHRWQGKATVVRVKPGKTFRRLKDRTYEVHPASEKDYRQLIVALEDKDLLPDKIVHFWARTAVKTGENAIQESLDRGFYSLYTLIRALTGMTREKPLPILYGYTGHPEETLPFYAGLAGFMKSLLLESKKFPAKVIEFRIPRGYAGDDPIPGAAARIFLDEAVSDKDFDWQEVAVRYAVGTGENAGKWTRYRLAPESFVPEVTAGQPVWRERGVYLISGGLGALGLIFARHLAQKYRARLVLTDRFALTPPKEAVIQELGAAGAETIYVQADISNRPEVEKLVAKARARFKTINGIIHAAGIIQDALLVNQTLAQVEQVLAPKVFGTVYLDEATAGEALDFFALFSSIAAVCGGPGQTAYGFANNFLDHYAGLREERCARGKRRGKTLSINWPLWKEGGMKMDEKLIDILSREMGIDPLDTETGLETFELGLGLSESRFGVVAGNRQKIDRSFRFPVPGADRYRSEPEVSGISTGGRQVTGEAAGDRDAGQEFQDDLVSIISGLLKIPLDKISLKANIGKYGFDSIAFTELAQQLNSRYRLNLTPDIFFEHKTIGAMAVSLFHTHKESITPSYRPAPQEEQAVVPPLTTASLPYTPPVLFQEKEDRNGLAGAWEPVAIIGMSGRLPQSEDLETFWLQRLAGKNFIGEIPADRWRWQDFPAVRWGGFMLDADKFDPLFFNISPREAELLDPQQRLMIETVWHVIEDAGYRAFDLAGTDTGIFIGASTLDYQKLLDIGHRGTTEQLHFMIPNRISYILDVHGPSEAVDTACSSSLVALHRAVEAIQSGACRLTVAGGVNLIADPYLFLAQANAGMLSRDGRCYTFDKKANGYVRGEGVGAVLLKSFKQAEKDGDHIYAVIRATAVNHGGHTSSPTTPNPVAQAELVCQAFTKAGIDPATVTYIEAHGTGTSLGDPLEINGLKMAFEKMSVKPPDPLAAAPICGIGTIKTSIGHLEAAAGMAGIFNVLLAMKHETLPGNAHFQELNPLIKLAASPFYIVDKTRSWERLKDSAGRPIPRRAGVSSFGIGGANAHVVLEEYRETRQESAYPQTGAYLVVLSARNEERLRVYAGKLAQYLDGSLKEFSLQLADIAYTLQIGREPLAVRLAMVVESLEELTGKLRRASADVADGTDIYRGSARNEGGNGATAPLSKDGNSLDRLAAAWVSGASIDWHSLYPGFKPRRISLPTYPFARKSFWVQVQRQPLAPGMPQDQPPLKTREYFYYLPQWKLKPAAPGQTIPLGSEKPGEKEAVLLIVPPDCAGLDKALYSMLLPGKVVRLLLGQRSKKRAADNWELDMDDPLALDKAIGQICALQTVRRIYFLAGLVLAETPIDEQKPAGLLALFRLVKALNRHELSRMPIDLTVVTHQVFSILPGEKTRPVFACLSGLARTLAREYPHFRVFCIDTDLNNSRTPQPGGQDSAILAIAEAIGSQTGDKGFSQVAIRQGRCYVPVIKPVVLPENMPAPFKENGVYMIVGGLGRIGLELARYLAAHYRARLVLLGRSPLDEERQEKITEIEAAGGQVLYIQADVAGIKSMSAAVKKARSTYGSIDGAIHSAMEVKNGTLENIDEEMFFTGLSPKLAGSRVLAQVLADRPLDFLLFFSSCQSLLGEPGMSNYVAGNAFQDAFSHHLSSRCPYPVRVIDWGYWRLTGDRPGEKARQSLALRGLGPFDSDDGLKAVADVLANPLTQVICLRADAGFLEKIGLESPPPDGVEHLEQYPLLMPSIIYPAVAAVKEEQPALPPAMRQHLDEAHRQTEAFSHYLLLDAFQRLGVCKRPGDAYDHLSLKAGLKIIPVYERFFNSLLTILEKAGFVCSEEPGPRWVGTGKLADPQVTAKLSTLTGQRERLSADFPEMEPAINLMCTCLEKYPQILTGEIPATDVMFPGSSMELMEKLYKGNVEADSYNRLVTWGLLRYIRTRLPQLTAGQKIEILEIGAGTGGTSGPVFEAIRAYSDHLHYVYTDISPAFAKYGRESYGRQNPYVDFKVLDIEKDTAGQGLNPGRFDIILATNVIHATRRIEQTLDNVKVLLKANGWVIINEGTRINDAGTIMFGLLEGWWLYEDEENRHPNCPLMGISTWQRLLAVKGFSPVIVLGQPGDQEGDGRQHVFVAESNGLVKGTSRLITETSPAHEPVTREETVTDKETAPATPARPVIDPVEYVEEKIIATLSHVLQLGQEDYDPASAFSDFGVDSILAIEIVDKLNQALAIRLRSTDLFNYATIQKLTAYIAGEFGDAIALPPVAASPEPLSSQPRQTGDQTAPASGVRGGRESEVAVIGMSGCFPDADNVDQLWQNLLAGKNSVTEAKRWALDSFYDPDPERADRSYCKWAGFLAHIDEFDPLFFNISPKEADMMDPQQRIFLQECYHALEDAGYSDRYLEGRQCSVFAGFNASDYHRVIDENVQYLDAYCMTGNYEAMLSARISYFLDLRGPSITVNTACSSSLVAVHLACESVRSGESEISLAGGVSIISSSHFFVLLCRTGVLSFSGQCRAFDDAADGIALGEGVGVVVLKSLSAALRDGDHIHGVIIGSAINQDGKSNGITAPNAPSQTALECSVYDRYGINPQDIDYIETHGTGTRLGDPIEVDALTDAFKKYTGQKQFCALGSIKTNIGHSAAAAGVSGLIKLLLSLKYKQIVPSLHFTKPNQFIDFADTPFYFNTQLKDWPSIPGKPRLGAISSFGFSGTNAHLVVREAETPAGEPGEDKPWYMIPISAKNKDALKQKMAGLVAWLKGHGQGNLENKAKACRLQDISFTLLVGRSHFSWRCCLLIDAGSLTDGLAGHWQDILAGNLSSPEKTKNYLTPARKDIRFKPDPAREQMGQALIRELASGGPAGEHYREKLHQLARLYTEGYDLDWPGLYQGQACRRLSLPTYPFARERYWITGRDEQTQIPGNDPIMTIMQQLERGEITESEALRLTETL